MKMDYVGKVIAGATIVSLEDGVGTSDMIIECVKDGEPLKIKLSAREGKGLLISVEADWE